MNFIKSKNDFQRGEKFMYCGKCGKDVGAAAFCPYCGAKIEAGEESGARKENRQEGHIKLKTRVNIKSVGGGILKKRKKEIGILAVSVCVIAGIVLFCTIAFRKSKSEIFLNYFEQGNYAEARQYFENELAWDAEEEEKVYQAACAQIDRLVEDCYAGKISCDAATEGISLFWDFYPDETADANEAVDALRVSQDYYQDAEARYEAGNYSAAKDLYEMVIEEDSSYADAQEKIELCYQKEMETLLAEADEMAAGGSPMDAALLLENSKSDIRSEDLQTVSERQETYYQQYESDVLSTAQEYAQAGDYEKAISVLNTADQSYSAEKFQAAIEEYEQYAPVNLMTVEPVSDNISYDRRNEQAEDIYGNTYAGYYDLCNYRTKDEDTYVEFLIPGKQNHFSGILFCPSRVQDGHTIDLEIYLDDILIYEQRQMNKRSEPVHFDLAIGEGKFLKVVTRSMDDTFTGTNPRVGLTDAKLYYVAE